MHVMRGHAKDPQFLAVFEIDRLEFGVLGHQAQDPATVIEALHCEFTIHRRKTPAGTEVSAINNAQSSAARGTGLVMTKTG